MSFRMIKTIFKSKKEEEISVINKKYFQHFMGTITFSLFIYRYLLFDM